MTCTYMSFTNFYNLNTHHAIHFTICKLKIIALCKKTYQRDDILIISRLLHQLLIYAACFLPPLCPLRNLMFCSHRLVFTFHLLCIASSLNMNTPCPGYSIALSVSCPLHAFLSRHLGTSRYF